MDESLTKHPKYTWLWLTKSGDVWTSLSRIKGSHEWEDTGVPQKRLNIAIHKYGYRVVVTSKDNKLYNLKVCRLMADIWLPDAKLVTHKDGDRLNDRLSNLEATTLSKVMLKNDKSRGASGHQGLYWDRRMWSVFIMLNKRYYRIGSTTSKKKIPELLARREAIKKHFLETGEVDLMKEPK